MDPLEGFVADFIVVLPRLARDEIWPPPLRERWHPEALALSEEGWRAWRFLDPGRQTEVCVLAEPAPAESARRRVAFAHRPRAACRREDMGRAFELGLCFAEFHDAPIDDPYLEETFLPDEWAYRITEPFEIRNFIATHWLAASASEESHRLRTLGLARFGLAELETADVPRDERHKVACFLHQAAELWLDAEAPPPTGEAQLEGIAVHLALCPCEAGDGASSAGAARLFAPPRAPSLCVTPAAESWAHALGTWQARNVQRISSDLVDRLRSLASLILPRVWARLADGARISVKARFPVQGVGHTTFESMWVEVLERIEGKVRGRLANDPEVRRDLARGAEVEIEEGEIWDIIAVDDGSYLRGVELRRWLREAQE